MLPLYCGIMPTYGGKHICDIMADAAPVTGRLCRPVWSNALDRACVISRPSQILSLCDKTAVPWQSILPNLKTVWASCSLRTSPHWCNSIFGVLTPRSRKKWLWESHKQLVLRWHWRTTSSWPSNLHTGPQHE